MIGLSVSNWLGLFRLPVNISFKICGQIVTAATFTKIQIAAFIVLLHLVFIPQTQDLTLYPILIYKYRAYLLQVNAYLLL